MDNLSLKSMLNLGHKGPRNIYIDEGYAYIACREGNTLSIVSIEDLDKPKEVSTVSTDEVEGPYTPIVNGNYCFLTARDGNGYTAIDVSNPASPSVVHSVSDKNWEMPWDQTIQDGYAYITILESASIAIIDISNAQNMEIISSITDPRLGRPQGATLKDETLYVATDRESKIVSIDVSDPTNPTISGVLNHPHYFDGSHTICVRNNYVISSARYSNKLNSLSIHDTNDLELVDSITIPGSPRKFIIQGQTAIVGSGSGRITLVDISDPNNLKEKTNVMAPGARFPRGLFFKDGFLFVATHSGYTDGLMIFGNYNGREIFNSNSLKDKITPYNTSIRHHLSNLWSELS